MRQRFLHALCHLPRMVLINCSDQSDPEFDTGSLIFLIIRKEDFLIALAFIRQCFGMQSLVESLYVRYSRKICQADDRLTICFSNRRDRQVCRIGQYGSQ